MTDALAVLAPAAVPVTVAGRTFEVAPIRVKDLPAFARTIEPIARDLLAGDVAGALARNADALIAATAIGARVERDWLDEQTAEELVALAIAVVEVNADFFVRRLLPRLTQTAETLTQRLQAAGLTS